MIVRHICMIVFVSVQVGLWFIRRWGKFVFPGVVVVDLGLFVLLDAHEKLL